MYHVLPERSKTYHSVDDCTILQIIETLAGPQGLIVTLRGYNSGSPQKQLLLKKKNKGKLA